MEIIGVITIIFKVIVKIIEYRNDPERAEREALDTMMDGFDRRISDAGKAWADRSTGKLSKVIARHNNARTRGKLQDRADKKS